MNNQLRCFLFGLTVLVTITTLATIDVIQAQTPVLPTITPLPSPSPSIEDRLNRLESQVDALSEQVETRPKDIWDKIDAISGLVSGILIALIGGVATHIYRERQQATEQARNKRELTILETQTIQSFMPQLQSGDPKAVEAALLSIAALGKPKLANDLALLFRTEGAVSALSKIASNPDRVVARQAEKSLSSVESEALRKLRLICEKVEDPNAKFADWEFASGTYGYNVHNTELDVMVRRGWVQISDGEIRITKKGRELAGQE